jgi:hypothetical protein
MLGAAKIMRISAMLSRVKSSALPFGDVFVLFGGDFNQLSAVLDTCLYSSISPLNDSPNVRAIKRLQNEGLRLWKAVVETGVVILIKNYRTQDPDLRDTLNRVRRGRTTPADLKKFHDRVFGSPNGPSVEELRWKSAVLVTPRNIVRQAWNHQACLRHVAVSGQQLFISPAVDTNVPSHQLERVIWEVDAKTQKLATWNLLAVGGPVIATSNVAVELGIANGTRAVVKEVVPHQDDEVGWSQVTHEPIVILSQPPACVWIQVDGFGNKETEPEAIGQPELYSYSGSTGQCDWFPVLPIDIEVTLQKPDLTFNRVQTPLTPGSTPYYILATQLIEGFAASDYRVQGMGLDNYIIDLRKPPDGKFRLENIYVMLSRATTWEAFAILCPFEDRLFTDCKVNVELEKYNESLDCQSETSKQRLMEEHLYLANMFL